MDTYRIKDLAKEKWVWFIVILDVIAVTVRIIRGLPGQNNIVMEVLLYILLISLSVLCFTDAKLRIIPNRILIIMILAFVFVVGGYMIVNIDGGFALLIMSLAAAVFSGVSFLVCYFITKGQLGAGDVKLAFVMGLYLTPERIFPVIIYGMILCCIFSLVMIAAKKLGLKDGLPLVPFLFIGLCITLALV